MEALPLNSMCVSADPKDDTRQCIGYGSQEDPSPTISTVHHHGVAMSYDGYNQKGFEETCNTLRTGHGSAGENTDATPKVAHTLIPSPIGVDSYNQSIEGHVSHTLRDPKGGDNVAKVATQYIVRRLTPKETERLMGYPDGYTIPQFKEITDELVEEFVKIHNDFNALMNPGKTIKPKTHKQIRKWLESISNPATCSDAPRYKVCGNGWAINCAQWVLQGVTKFLITQNKE